MSVDFLIVLFVVLHYYDFRYRNHYILEQVFNFQDNHISSLQAAHVRQHNVLYTAQQKSMNQVSRNKLQQYNPFHTNNTGDNTYSLHGAESFLSS